MPKNRRFTPSAPMRVDELAFPKALLLDNDPGSAAQPLMPGPEITLIGAYWE